MSPTFLPTLHAFKACWTRYSLKGHFYRLSSLGEEKLRPLVLCMQTWDFFISFESERSKAFFGSGANNNATIEILGWLFYYIVAAAYWNHC